MGWLILATVLLETCAPGYTVVRTVSENKYIVYKQDQEGGLSPVFSSYNREVVARTCQALRHEVGE